MSPERTSMTAAAMGARAVVRVDLRVRQTLLDLLLQVDVEGELDVLAELGVGLADELAVDVVDDLAAPAPQEALAGVLHAVLAAADLALAVTGQRIVRKRFQVARLRRRADPADGLGGGRRYG